MRKPFVLHSFSARLVMGIVVLVLSTTLSAGVPAYWLTSAALERQARTHVAGAEQATASLLRAERERLANLLALLVERPTLQRLLQEATESGATPRASQQRELFAYLRAFQRQSGLDLLLLCDPASTSSTADGFRTACPSPLPTGFVLWEEQPALVAALPVRAGAEGEPPPTVLAGIWLDGAFLRQTAANTGVEQSVLAPDGTRLASSIGNDSALEVAASPIVPNDSDVTCVRMGGQHFYTTRLLLTADDGSPTLLWEPALPVDELFLATGRARSILVISTGVVALLGMVLGVWLVRRLTDSLAQLTRSAEAISGGDLSATIPRVAGPSEVRTLAAALRQSQASMWGALNDLAQTRNWLDDLLQSIVEGVVTFDEAGHITFLNSEAAALAALPAEEAIGQHIDQIFAVTDDGGNRISLQQLPLGGRQRVRLARNGNGSEPSLRLPGRRVGRRLSRSLSLAPEPVAALDVTVAHLRAPAGEAMETVLVLRDISQEESLRHLRSYFLANITHEFRTPLSTLNASMELLVQEEDLSVAEMRELLQPIHRSMLSLQTLIDNLLESGSIEAGRFILRRQPVALADVIEDAVRLVQPLLERRTQTLARTAPPHLPPLVGDSGRLTQVLVNLLSNASKYSPPGTIIDLRVEQLADQQVERLRVWVADRGPGIPAAERDTIFRRFVRLDADDSEQYGIGLGLHVVKTTIEAHGGAVGVDARTGGGALFWFELPTQNMLVER